MTMYFQLTDVDEQHAPPEKVLDLSVIGDEVSIAVRSYDESYTTSTLTAQGQIIVDWQSLLNVLMIGRDDECRSAKRRAAEARSREAREQQSTESA